MNISVGASSSTARELFDEARYKPETGWYVHTPGQPLDRPTPVSPSPWTVSRRDAAPTSYPKGIVNESV